LGSVTSLVVGLTPLMFFFIVGQIIAGEAALAQLQNFFTGMTSSLGATGLWTASKYGYYLFGVAGFVAIATVLQYYCFALVGERFACRIRKTLFGVRAYWKYQ